MNVYMIEV